VWLVPKEATETKQGTPAAVFATPTHNHPLPAFLPRPATALQIFSDHHSDPALHAQRIHMHLWATLVRVMQATAESMAASATSATLGATARTTML